MKFHQIRWRIIFTYIIENFLSEIRKKFIHQRWLYKISNLWTFGLNTFMLNTNAISKDHFIPLKCKDHFLIIRRVNFTTITRIKEFSMEWEKTIFFFFLIEKILITYCFFYFWKNNDISFYFDKIDENNQKRKLSLLKKFNCFSENFYVIFESIIF